MRRLPTVVLLLASALAVPRLHGQAPQQRDQEASAFEVASVKANTSRSPRSGTQTSPGGRVTITNQPLRTLIRQAYGSDDMEVIGGPDWVDVDRWDILAVAPPGGADKPWHPMLRSLLAERFTLRAHLEQRERPIYRLVLARGDQRLGPDFHSTACGTDDLGCGNTLSSTGDVKGGTIIGRGRTLAEIGTSLSRYAERRVFDHTSLGGRYDFELRWSEDLSFFTALQEQLGLKLESTRGPIEVVLIDHVERPTPD